MWRQRDNKILNENTYILHLGSADWTWRRAPVRGGPRVTGLSIKGWPSLTLGFLLHWCHFHYLLLYDYFPFASVSLESLGVRDVEERVKPCTPGPDRRHEPSLLFCGVSQVQGLWTRACCTSRWSPTWTPRPDSSPSSVCTLTSPVAVLLCLKGPHWDSTHAFQCSCFHTYT